MTRIDTGRGTGNLSGSGPATFEFPVTSPGIFYLQWQSPLSDTQNGNGYDVSWNLPADTTDTYTEIFTPYDESYITQSMVQVGIMTVVIANGQGAPWSMQWAISSMDQNPYDRSDPYAQQVTYSGGGAGGVTFAVDYAKHDPLITFIGKSLPYDPGQLISDAKTATSMTVANARSFDGGPTPPGSESYTHSARSAGVAAGFVGWDLVSTGGFLGLFNDRFYGVSVTAGEIIVEMGTMDDAFAQAGWTKVQGGYQAPGGQYVAGSAVHVQRNLSIAVNPIDLGTYAVIDPTPRPQAPDTVEVWALSGLQARLAQDGKLDPFNWAGPIGTDSFGSLNENSGFFAKRVGNFGDAGTDFGVLPGFDGGGGSFGTDGSGVPLDPPPTIHPLQLPPPSGPEVFPNPATGTGINPQGPTSSTPTISHDFYIAGVADGGNTGGSQPNSVDGIDGTSGSAGGATLLSAFATGGTPEPPLIAAGFNEGTLETSIPDEWIQAVQLSDGSIKHAIGIGLTTLAIRTGSFPSVPGPHGSIDEYFIGAMFNVEVGYTAVYTLPETTFYDPFHGTPPGFPPPFPPPYPSGGTPVLKIWTGHEWRKIGPEGEGTQLLKLNQFADGHSWPVEEQQWRRGFNDSHPLKVWDGTKWAFCTWMSPWTKDATTGSTGTPATNGTLAAFTYARTDGSVAATFDSSISMVKLS